MAVGIAAHQNRRGQPLGRSAAEGASGASGLSGGGYRPPDSPHWRLRRAGSASRGVGPGAVALPERSLAPEAPAGGSAGAIAPPERPLAPEAPAGG
eukprot:15033766-Alexandrium_andersonii.AAC.1